MPATAPIEIRATLTVAGMRELATFAAGCGWLSPERAERARREASEMVALSLATDESSDALQALVRHLRQTEQLTPALVLRAILSGRLTFVEAALADLAHLPIQRVGGLVSEAAGPGFSALYERAGLPRELKPAFVAGLQAVRDAARHPAGGSERSRRTLERVMAACGALPRQSSGKLLSFLRRFEAQAAREEARRIADALVDDMAERRLAYRSPEALEDDSFAAAA